MANKVVEMRNSLLGWFFVVLFYLTILVALGSVLITIRDVSLEDAKWNKIELLALQAAFWANESASICNDSRLSNALRSSAFDREQMDRMQERGACKVAIYRTGLYRFLCIGGVSLLWCVMMWMFPRRERYMRWVK